jgi:hypothetical protein
MDNKEERASHRSGQDIINHLSVILRTAQIHDAANIAVTTAIEKYLALINPLTASEDVITLELVGGFLYQRDEVRYSRISPQLRYGQKFRTRNRQRHL